MPALEARDLSKWFGGLAALDGLDLSVEPGEILGLIGPNGAGKSTALGVMSGFLSPSRGQVVLEGEDITGSPPITAPVGASPACSSRTCCSAAAPSSTACR
ncbi:MAG: ATP-binding cassette domain-containing protein [Thermoleophilia bacterium]|nr:ATP-binding cassette domain-containing protein [Thermoleophilia bacterium]